MFISSTSDNTTSRILDGGGEGGRGGWRGGVPFPAEEVNPICQDFHRELHENEKKWTWGVPSAPPWIRQ